MIYFYIFYLQNRVVNQEALDELIDDLSFPAFSRIKLLDTWPKGFQKAVLKAYAEFIELKIVFQDWNSACIVPPYPVRQLWRRHAARYSGLCEKLFKNVIIYIGDHISTEQVQFTCKAYSIRFNHSPCKNIWDFYSTKIVWKNRIADWDKQLQHTPAKSNELVICEKSVNRDNENNIKNDHVVNTCQKNEKHKTKKHIRQQKIVSTSPGFTTRSSAKKKKFNMTESNEEIPK